MSATKRKVVTRLLLLGESVATIAMIVMVATVWPVRAAIFVAACVLVVLVMQRREVASLVHRLTGR